MKAESEYSYPPLSEYSEERDGAGHAPLVSIYVSTYNQEEYIRQCLDGILVQRCPFGVEALVIDDASTDSTPEIILEYARRYPHIIKPVLLTENLYSQRRSKLREHFLPTAGGKYMAVCEGDDYWTYPGKLAAQISFMERHPGYAACMHAHDVRNESSLTYFRYYPQLRHSRRLDLLDLIILQVIQTASAVGRIDVLRDDAQLKSEAADPEHRFIYDLRIFLSWLNAGRVYAFAGQWSVYRLHDRGVATAALIDGTAEARHRRFLDWLGTLYGNKYEHDIARMHRMWQHLEAWTALRRQKKYAQAANRIMKALTTGKTDFLKLYWHRYIY
ncbi:MAG: glycosyltransferase family 2 protein [Muribaculaceae bacterium]|nr:glycosyltransferase family 2 protein [Muribaculaceae bacterium]